MRFKNKSTHKRTVLSTETFTVDMYGIGEIRVKAVLWCMPDAESSRTYTTDNVRLTLIAKGISSTEARHFRRPVKINKNKPIESFEARALKAWNRKDAYRSLVKDAFNGDYQSHGLKTEVFCKLYGGQRLNGTVAYVNEDDHYKGEIETSFGRIGYWRCNFEGANSPYASLVSNIPVERGSSVSFEIPKDPYMFYALGGINLRVGGES